MSTQTDPGPSTKGKTDMTVVGEKQGGGVLAFVKKQAQQSLAFGTLILLVVFFSIASPAFLTWSNISGVLLATAVIGILALGTTFVIITGGIDLSIGTGMTLAAVMTGVFIVNMGLPVWLGVLGGVLTGGLMGFVNGVNIAFLRLPPFIATLAMMLIAQGLSLIISGVRPIYFSGVADDFKQIALGTIIPGLPNAVLITLVAAIVAFVVLGKTILGRYTFSIGSNEEATRLSGVNTRRWKIMIYTFAGLFTGVAGVVIASRLDSAQPQLGRWLRAAGNCSSHHRWHLAPGRARLHPRNRDRGAHHERRDQRPANHVDPDRMAERCRRNRHPDRRLLRHAPQPRERVTRAQHQPVHLPAAPPVSTNKMEIQ